MRSFWWKQWFETTPLCTTSPFPRSKAQSSHRLVSLFKWFLSFSLPHLSFTLSFSSIFLSAIHLTDGGMSWALWWGKWKEEKSHLLFKNAARHSAVQIFFLFRYFRNSEGRQNKKKKRMRKRSEGLFEAHLLSYRTLICTFHSLPPVRAWSVMTGVYNQMECRCRPWKIQRILEILC